MWRPAPEVYSHQWDYEPNAANGEAWLLWLVVLFMAFMLCVFLTIPLWTFSSGPS